VAAITQFVPVDLLDQAPLTGLADANGVITVVSDEVPPGQFWELERAVIVCDSATIPTFTLYRGGVSTINARAGTPAGNFAVAEGFPPLRIPSGFHVTGQWTGADVGSIGVLVLEGLLVQRVQVGTYSLTGG